MDPDHNRTERTYDGANRIQTEKHYNAAGDLLDETQWSYDDAHDTETVTARLHDQRRRNSERQRDFDREARALTECRRQ